MTGPEVLDVARDAIYTLIVVSASVMLVELGTKAMVISWIWVSACSSEMATPTARPTSMTGPEVLDVARDAIYTLIIVSAPVMLVGLAVGVAISLLQALTQIQEMTIAFVPKILAIFISLLVALPFMAEKLHAEMLRIAARIVSG